MPVKYVKLTKDGVTQKVQSDRVERFQELGWSKVKEEKSLSKNKITACAEVTSMSEDEVEDWDPSQGDWADSEESISVDDKLPEDEEN